MAVDCRHASLPLKRGTANGIVLVRQLPDGFGTSGVVAEVPRFPLMDFHGKNVGKAWKHVAACGKVWRIVRTESNIWPPVRGLWPFCENPVFVPTLSGSR